MFSGGGQQNMNGSDPCLSSNHSIPASKANWKQQYSAQRQARREAKVVQKSAVHVDKIVRELADGLPFLVDTPNQPIAKFQRSEIVVGNLLGRGVFARVYEIKDFALHDEEEGEKYSDRARRSTMSQTVANNVQAALDEAQEMIVLDSSSSDDEAPPTLDSRPFGARLDQLAMGELPMIAEIEDVEGQQQGQQNGDDSTTGGTSSTAPASSPPTPPLTPASEEVGPREAGRLQPNPHRFSTPIYQQHLMGSSRRLDDDPVSLRLQARDSIRSGEKVYALKHLTKTLLRNPKDFHLAAAALVIEAKYLAKLNHPNIIKIAGLAMCGYSVSSGGIGGPTQHQGADAIPEHFRRRSSGSDQDGLESGHHDSYFLISERLTDTLDRRIRQWKRDQPTHKKLSDQTSGQKIQTWRHMMRKTSYALQISNALAYLHERKLLYRDLKPQNIGFIGDNQTICIFNFGVCRELNPCTQTVKEDPITALFGALSWKYTAVECFPQSIVHTPGDFLANGARLLHAPSSLSSLSLSFRGHMGRRMSSASEKMQEVRRELEVVNELNECAPNANVRVSSAFSDTTSVCGMENATQKIMKIPEYDVKVDVYSWAMVYYEMLTMNQPFSGMTQSEHLRKVAGPKGGQRPGVYQFDLTPSMISLLHRSWDQNPRKRPTMESVSRNLHLILKELEQLIKDEQKTLLKAAGGTEDAVAALTTKQERAARRARRHEEREKQMKKGKRRLATRKSSVMTALKRTSDGVFARNRYRSGDVRESVIEISDGLSRPSSKAMPGLGTSPAIANQTRNRASISEIDVDALEYEVLLSDDEDDEEDSAASFQSELLEGSSLTFHLETTVENDAMPKGVDLDITASDDEKNNAEPSSSENSDDKDCVGNAIAAIRHKKPGHKGLPSRDRNLSSQSGGGAGRLRRTTKSGSLKAAVKSRRNVFDVLPQPRRGTHRMSRRTMRLSRANLLLMRRDVRVLVITISILLTFVCCGTCHFWYKRRQATWLGVRLDNLSEQRNETEARRLLRNAMIEECRRESQGHDTSAPMLFKGGALSPVDLECMAKLERLLEEKMVKVTGFDPGKVIVTEVGFLGMQHFAKPPPQPKKRWKRKKAWKFFRDSSRVDSVFLSADKNRPVPLAGSHARTTTADPKTVEGESSLPYVETLPQKVGSVIDGSPLEEAQKEFWETKSLWKFFAEYPNQGTAEEAGLLGMFKAITKDWNTTTTKEL